MKKTIFLNFVVLLVTTTSASAVTLLVPDEHTVALWHLDGDGVDSSGNGNHLAIKTDRVSFVPGKFGQAALMGNDPWSGSCWNSDGGALTAPGSGCTYPGSGDWTVEAWVLFPSNSKGYYAVSHYSKHWAGHDPYHVGVSNGEAYFLIEEGDGEEYASMTSADISGYVGQWVHLAGVYRSRQDIALYVNGIQVAHKATTLAPEYLPGYDVFVGGSYCGTSTGLIVDEVRLSNVARYGGTARILSPWQPQNDMPVADHGFGDAVVGGLIYAIGGSGPDPGWGTNRVQRYNPATDTWVQVASMPTARHSLNCAVVDGYIYAIGGHVANSRRENERYDPSTNTWQSMARKPTAVSSPGVAAFGDRIYTFGGNRYGSYQSVIDVYDPSTNTWQSVGNMPAAGLPIQAATLGDKIYLAGGYFLSEGGTTDHLWAYDPVSGTWDTGLPKLNVARHNHELVAFGDYLFAIGGTNPSGYLTSVEWWTPGASAWTLDESLNVARGYFGAEAVGNTIYAFGGWRGAPGDLSSTESAVVILEPTDPPVADAGDDVVADANEVVILDGSVSYDPDGEIIQYTWKRLPDDVVIYSGKDPNCQTRALGRVEEVIELTVTDNYGSSATDTLRIISRTTQNLQDQVAAMQSQIEELQRQIQELRALVDKIVSWPPIRKRLRRSPD